MMENKDFISKIPDEILSSILSKLRVDEAVRCDILSKRWKKGLWKKTSRMEFHGKHMIMPLTQLLHSQRSTSSDQDQSLNKSIQKGVSRYGRKISQCLNHHDSKISSCHIMHFKKSLVNGDLNTWLDFLIHRRNGFLKDLSLECIPNIIDEEKDLDTNIFDGDRLVGKYFDVLVGNILVATCVPEICKPLARGIFYCLDSLELTNYTIGSSSPFENCGKLKTLKLKRIRLDQSTLNGILENCVVLENFSLLEPNGFTSLIIIKSELKVIQLEDLSVTELKVIAENLEVLVFHSISFSAGSLSIYAPILQKFQCDDDSLFSRILPIEKFVMEQQQIPVHYTDLLGLQPSNMATIFENMVTLCINLDLKNVINNIGIYLILKSCLHLKNLKINNQVNDGSWAHIENDFLPYPINLFWQRIEISECMNNSLKSLCIKGYTGNGYEIEFVKCLITNARDIERITLWFVDDCSWVEVAATQVLLSFPKASTKLFIDLKPGPEYVRKVGGSFQMWVTTLGN